MSLPQNQELETGSRNTAAATRSFTTAAAAATAKLYRSAHVVGHRALPGRN